METISKLIFELLKEGFIKSSKSPFHPIISRKKKDDTWHFCVDYKALNATTDLSAFLYLQ